MSTPADLQVRADDLRQIASVLDAAGSALFEHAPDLDTAPDAGASSDEAAQALAALSGAVAGLAQHLGHLAESTGSANTDFSGTDTAVGGAFGSVGP